MKQIEELTDEDLMELWPAIGGAPHLFEYGKDELKKVLIDGQCADENDEPIGLQLDFYTMAAIVDTLRARGFGEDKVPVECWIKASKRQPDDFNTVKLRTIINDGGEIKKEPLKGFVDIDYSRGRVNTISRYYLFEEVEWLDESGNEGKVPVECYLPQQRLISLLDALKAVDGWLNSEDTWTNGERIECKSGSLISRFLKATLPNSPVKEDWKEEAENIIREFLNQPYGCARCDSGKVRNPDKGHFDDCPFLLAEKFLQTNIINK